MKLLSYQNVSRFGVMYKAYRPMFGFFTVLKHILKSKKLWFFPPLSLLRKRKLDISISISTKTTDIGGINQFLSFKASFVRSVWPLARSTANKPLK